MVSCVHTCTWGDPTKEACGVTSYTSVHYKPPSLGSGSDPGIDPDPRLGFWWSTSKPRIQGWHNPSLGIRASGLTELRPRIPSLGFWHLSCYLILIMSYTLIMQYLLMVSQQSMSNASCPTLIRHFHLYCNCHLAHHIVLGLHITCVHTHRKLVDIQKTGLRT